MTKKMIYLEEGMQEDLERIAHSENKSVSQVIREAIKKLFQSKKHPNLEFYDKRMANYLAKPSAAASFRDVLMD